MKAFIVILALALPSCAPMPESLRGYGEPKWQWIGTVIQRSSGV
jgi:hypothetical protein